jgi:predicted N-acetyltransferase YhbS
MTWDLVAHEPPTVWATPELPARLLLAPVGSKPSAAVMPVIRAAFPPGHPDHDPAADQPGAEAEFVDPFVSGARMGPFLSDASALVVDELRGSTVAAVLLLNRTPGRPPHGGPWVTDVARDPDPPYAGTGSALLRRGLRVLFDAGEAALSLVVTDGNPAALQYARMGFAEVAVSGRVRVPG